MIATAVASVSTALGWALLHAGTVGRPVPHWVVLLVAVPALGLTIGGAVLVLDRLLTRVGW